MNSPGYNYGWIGEEWSLVFALVTGVGFGFFLERAGLGNARKLSAQFYLQNLAVFKMMFTTIVTAMTGVFVLNWLGVLHVDLIFLTPTYVWPQLVGGLVFGAGFIVGGYCPGTSCVASATGSVDGMVNIAGLLVGIFLFGELHPWMDGFYTAGFLGEVRLTDYVGLPEGVLVSVLIVVALVGFWVAERLEARTLT